MIPQLPFGVSRFADIQAAPDVLYVDKTRLLALLFAQRHSPHLFLTRPRRFGKTLLLSTVEALFQGRRDLFVDTWIGQSERWDWEGRMHPVLRLDLGLRGLHDAARLETQLGILVAHEAQEREISLPDAALPPMALRLLLRQMATAGRRVVVLVDEYDTAVTENLDRPDALEDILDILRAFYGALKDSADAGFVECTLVTGITRLAHAGLFSGANHLADLSHRPDVNDLLGFTHTELREPRVAALVAQGARNLGCTPAELYAALERQYNGYRFAEGAEAVFNPYTLAGCLEELAIPGAAIRWSLNRLPSNWAATGTPKVLLRGLRSRHMPSLTALEGQDARLLTQGQFDAGKPHVTALLFQAGYLTLDASVPPGLAFPNREVREAFAESLMEWFAETAPAWLESQAFPRVSTAVQLRDALLRQDAEAVCHVIASCLEAVPGMLYQFGDQHVSPHEPFYQALLHVLCQSLDLPLTAELPTGLGRVDLALELPARICLLEVKVDQLPEVALRRAFGTFYAAAWQVRSLPVTVWGVQFDRTAHTVQACQAWDLGRFDRVAACWEYEPFDIPLAELRRMPTAERQAYVRTASLREVAPRSCTD